MAIIVSSIAASVFIISVLSVTTYRNMYRVEKKGENYEQDRTASAPDKRDKDIGFTISNGVGPESDENFRTPPTTPTTQSSRSSGGGNVDSTYGEGAEAGEESGGAFAVDI